MKSLYNEDSFNVFYSASASNQQRKTNQRYPEQNFARVVPSGSEIENSIIKTNKPTSEINELLKRVEKSKLYDYMDHEGLKRHMSSYFQFINFIQCELKREFEKGSILYRGYLIKLIDEVFPLQEDELRMLPFLNHILDRLIIDIRSGKEEKLNNYINFYDEIKTIGGIHELSTTFFYGIDALVDKHSDLDRITDRIRRSQLTQTEKENALIKVFDRVITHSFFYRKIEGLTSLLRCIRNTPLSDQQKHSLANRFLLTQPHITPTWDPIFIGGEYLAYANYIAESTLSSAEKKALRTDLIFKMIAECKSPRCPESNSCSAVGFEEFLSEFKKNHFNNPKEKNVMLRHFIEIVIRESCAFCDDKRDLADTILKIGETSLETNDKAQLILKLTKEFNNIVSNYGKGHDVKLKEVIFVIKNSSLEEFQKAALIQEIKKEELNEKSKGTAKDKAHCHSFFSRIFHHKHHQSDSLSMSAHP